MRHLAPAKHENLATKPYRMIEVNNGISHILQLPGGQRIIAYSWHDGSFRVWDLETGTQRAVTLAWTSDGKTLIAGGFLIRKFDTATWREIAVLELEGHDDTGTGYVVSLSPNGHILASVASHHKTVQLWNLGTNQPIGTPLHYEAVVNCATFSVDGKFLVTSCDGHIYTWAVSAIVKKTGHMSDIADATSRPAPKIGGACRIPPGFFDDALREANLHIRLSAPRQRNLGGPFSSFWRRSKPHGPTEPDTQSRSRPLSWTRNLVSGILRGRDRSNIQLREVEVPCTWAKPRNYHARKKKPTTSSSRPPNTRTTQQPSGAAQSTPSSSQLPPPTTTSILSAVAGTTGASDTTSRPHITGAGWRARFVGWICCMPIQNADGHH
ncbi:WD40 repeat-like protein [Suillus weaverae]|nr:WD40 repeat-like protein [Suillus weaverae]